MRFRLAAFLALLLAFGAGSVSSESEPVIVLPNPVLLECPVANCTQLWMTDAGSTGAIFPIQLSMDIAKGCVYGFRARYGPEVPFENVQAAIDRKYGTFAVPLSADPKYPLKLWRVEPQKFSIQLSKGTEKSDRETLGEAISNSNRGKVDKSDITGIDVIYLRFKDTPCGGS